MQVQCSLARWREKDPNSHWRAMHLYVRSYIYIHIHTYMCTYIHTFYTYTYTYRYMRTSEIAWGTFIYTACVSLYTCLYIFIYLPIYLYICIYICIYIYMTSCTFIFPVCEPRVVKSLSPSLLDFLSLSLFS